MRLGIHIVDFGVPGGAAALAPELAAVGRAAEEAGVSRVSVMDHFFQMEQRAPASEPMLEAYTTLGYLAAHTSTVTLGVLVTGVTYRYPGLLAKTVATLDVLSGGRAELGIGAAWYEREHRALGVPFPPVAERMARLEEAVRVCLQMWDASNEGPFTGSFYELAETLCRPLPLHRPGIMIGGGGEKKTLRLVARYADACNLFATSPEDTAHKLSVLRAHCEAVGRDYAEIQKTMLYGGPVSDTDAFLRAMEPYAAQGFDTVILVPPADGPATWVERTAGAAVPGLADLGA